MRLKWDELARALVFWAALALVGMFIYLGWVCYISDSEIWSVTLAANIGEEWRHFWVAGRPIFYGVLALFEAPTQSAVATLLAARVACILNGLLIFFLTFRFAQTVSKNKLVPWLALLLLAGNSGFLNQGFRIRSDLFATSLSLWLLCGIFAEKPPRHLWMKWLALALATPKALFHMVCFLPFWKKLVPGWVKDPHLVFRVCCGIAALLIIVGAAVSQIYGSGFDYFVSSFVPGAGTPPIFSRAGFMYVDRIVTKNPLFIASLFFSFLVVIVRREERLLRFAAYLGMLLIWAILTPEKIPFFLASLLPPFCVFAALWVEGQGTWAPAMACVLALGTWFPGYEAFRENLTGNTNVAQLGMARVAEDLLDRYPGSRYYDVIGIVPKKARLRIFAGPNQVTENEMATSLVTSALPEFVFHVHKCNFLEPKLGDFLKKNYFDVGGEIWLRAYPFDSAVPFGSKDASTRIRALLKKVKPDLRPDGPNEIVLEVFSDNGHNERIVERLDQLDRWLGENRRVGKHLFITRVSPFRMPTEVLPGSMDHLFRFDSDF